MEERLDGVGCGGRILKETGEMSQAFFSPRNRRVSPLVHGERWVERNLLLELDTVLLMVSQSSSDRLLWELVLNNM